MSLLQSTICPGQMCKGLQICLMLIPQEFHSSETFECNRAGIVVFFYGGCCKYMNRSFFYIYRTIREDVMISYQIASMTKHFYKSSVIGVCIYKWLSDRAYHGALLCTDDTCRCEVSQEQHLYPWWERLTGTYESIGEQNTGKSYLIW